MHYLITRVWELKRRALRNSVCEISACACSAAQSTRSCAIGRRGSARLKLTGGQGIMARNRLKYHPGFGSEISSEALPHALPKGQVSAEGLLTVSELCVAFFSRTTHRYAHMACTASNCRGPPSRARAPPTREGALSHLLFAAYPTPPPHTHQLALPHQTMCHA